MLNQELASLYKSGHSLAEIANLFGVAPSTIGTRLRKHGTPLRTPGEGVHLVRCPVEPTVTEEMVELVDGLLLGDGTIGKDGRMSLGQTISHLDWVTQVHGHFQRLGLLATLNRPTKGGVADFGGKVYHRSPSVTVRTRGYDFLREQRLRWYPNGVKRVPQDVRLTPLAISQWYFGDGTVGGGGYRVTFCTDGFITEDVEFLRQKLRDKFGWSPLIPTKACRNRITLCCREDRKTLLDMVTPYTPVCFKYKLALKTTAQNMFSTEEGVAELIRLRQSGMSCAAIAQHLGVSRSGVFLAWSKVPPTVLHGR